ncbi:hypothetical protein SOW02_10295 [Pectobacterium actinidiae]|uniref:hypothetical protein n=1 Tax=Pectobacterium actinidiae TaxID=1507808 RepID=UPI002A7F2874|nr:hypothetical protein [Pectobacterium actinidiae]MDY4315325.1 hypothetical protein [Pectobacterium actinidiae]
MTDMKRSDMLYNDYSWTAVTGDDPTKTTEDRDRFSRKEGYEVLDLINAFKYDNGNQVSLSDQKVIEWMIHEKLPSNLQGKKKVNSWIAGNFASLKKEYPF